MKKLLIISLLFLANSTTYPMFQHFFKSGKTGYRTTRLSFCKLNQLSNTKPNKFFEHINSSDNPKHLSEQLQKDQLQNKVSKNFNFLPTLQNTESSNESYQKGYKQAIEDMEKYIQEKNYSFLEGAVACSLFISGSLIFGIALTQFMLANKTIGLL